MSSAFYRKYRPQTFKDLLGQDVVCRILEEAARRGKIGHAYLFAGPRGTGKTTTARLIAKVVNCMSEKEKPCNACVSCSTIQEGRAFDIIEIDAASNRGIDEIRNLKESVRVHPSSLRHKVFIIDEAHMLTKEAFNALLKTLEEPPAHVILILATTEIEKIPPTIASRTQQFFFKHLSVLDIIKKLEHIAKAEGIKISPEALDLIASSAEGSARDAESLFDQVATSHQKDREISLGTVEATLGKIGFEKIAKLAENLLKGNLSGALEMISDIDDNGYNLPQLMKDLIQYLRRVAVLSFTPSLATAFERRLSANHLDTIQKHTSLFKQEHLSLLKNLIAAYGQMRYSQFPIIPFEIAVIESLKK